MFQNRKLKSSDIGLILIGAILYSFFSHLKPTFVEDGSKPTLFESIILFLVLITILSLMYLYYQHKSYLYRKGIPGTATVVKIFKTGISIGTDSYRPQYEILMDVNKGESTIYRTTIKKYFDPNETVPGIGTTVTVKIHPKDKYKVVID